MTITGDRAGHRPSHRRGGGIGESATRPDGGPEGAGRVLLQRRPVGRRHVVGPCPPRRRTPRPASARIDIGPALAHPRCGDRAHRRRPARQQGLRARAPRPARARRRRRASRRRADRGRGRRPPRHRPPGAARPSSSTTRSSTRSPTPRRRSPRRRSTPTATCSATCASARATPAGAGRWWSRAPTRSACRTRRSWAPRPGWRIPAEDGGVDLIVSTQWLHNDRDQVAECLGLPPELVRLTLGGVGGAFGAREDVSLHIHACLLALRTGRPVKIVYSREESFLGHVHRHPAPHLDAPLAPSPTAPSSASRAASCSTAAPTGPRATTSWPTPPASAAGPTRSSTRWSTRFGVRTNNPPCGAMRGFGAVQVCFAHEAQMDKLAEACGVDPIELRLRNAMATGRHAAHRPGGRRAPSRWPR